MRYPRKSAEYNVIYSRLYGWIPNEFTLDLSPDIRRFIRLLLALYRKSENDAFICSYSYDFGYSILSRLKAIQREIVEVFNAQIRVDDKQFQAVKDVLKWDMTRCSWKQDEFVDYFSRFEFPGLTYPKTIASAGKWENVQRNQQNWFQRELHLLIQLREKEVYGSFACFKSLHLRLKPFLHNDHLKLLIQQHEKSPPSFYLTHICRGFEFLFKDYLSHYRQRSGIPFEAYGFRNFISERMEISTGRKSSIPQFSRFGTDASDGIEWPLEFLLKRFLGLFQ